VARGIGYMKAAVSRLISDIDWSSRLPALPHIICWRVSRHVCIILHETRFTKEQSARQSNAECAKYIHCVPKNVHTPFLANHGNDSAYPASVSDVNCFDCFMSVSTPVLPRDAMLARYMRSSCVRPSVHLSVRRSVCLSQADMYQNG